jgi:hypothetical protein
LWEEIEGAQPPKWLVMKEVCGIPTDSCSRWNWSHNHSFFSLSRLRISFRFSELESSHMASDLWLLSCCH